ncbi:MAG: CBS domain-containing protein [Candidatus Omnitrophica bacterium]|nr:CBS domain-containing protein [Candidatus Omnitrophota bacterium]MDD5671504.1 CBS domain-containing protein [Candidatus Omnitrophota bacterium]
MFVSDIMDVNILTIREGTTLSEVFTLMKSYNIREFPVVDNEFKLRGMVYEQNLLQIIYPAYKSLAYELPDVNDLKNVADCMCKMTVADIMEVQIVSLQADTPIMNAAAKMTAYKMARMPVLSQEKLIGMISQSKIFTEIFSKYLEKPVSIPELIIKPVFSAPPILSLDLKSHSSAEKRKYRRVPIKQPVAYRLKDSRDMAYGSRGAKLAEALNISAGGLLLLTKEKLAENTLVDLVFDLSGKNEPIRRLGRVCRCLQLDDPAFFHTGIMFLAMSPEEAAQIEKLLPEVK